MQLFGGSWAHFGVRSRQSNSKPIDEEAILNAASETGCIVSAEDHNIPAGLGSVVAEVVTSRCPVPVILVGVRDSFAEAGTPDWLAEEFGTSATHIVQAAHQAISGLRLEKVSCP